MEIINKYPPNYKKIKAVFGEDKRCVYCYGEAIYNPHEIKLEFHHVVHEKVHSEQQKELGLDYWWMRYMDDKDFRLKMELEAYAVQVKCAKDLVGEKGYRLFLDDVSEALASETYGNLLTKEQAKTKLRHLIKKI